MRHWITSFLLLTTEACYGDSLILKAGFFRRRLRRSGYFASWVESGPKPREVDRA